ncbi:MAG: hypothetical protein GX673_06045, partial [Gammaproteobacteria bacterium]|nr:hypothetical protein [Gammaproteobacteria bacterium]
KEAIDAKVAALSEASAPLAEKMYAEQAQQGEQATDATGDDNNDDVVDAEFEEVKDTDKK